jgi:VWFA-related protein
MAGARGRGVSRQTLYHGGSGLTQMVQLDVALIAGATVCAVAAGVSLAQAQETPVIPAGIELVRLDVVVVDRQGHPVPGLGAEEFEVREDGRLQKILTFEPVVVVAAGAPAEPAGRAVPVPETTARATPRPCDGRHLLIFFDDVHISPPFASRVRSQVGPYLVRALRDGDWVTVVAPDSGIQWTARSASEHRLLQKLVEHLPARFLSATEPSRGGHDEHAGDAGERALRQTLSGLERAVASLAGIPGHKSVVFVSEGLNLNLRLLELYERVIDEARRAQVAISFVNARGLSVGLEGWSANSSRPPILDSNAVMIQEAHVAGAAYLSSSTGGREFGVNDITRGVREALEESSVYYLLGYEPAATDGSLRKVRVRVLREGLQVRARERYYLKPIGAELPPEVRALRALADETALPLTVRAQLGRTSGNGEVETTLTLVLGNADRARSAGDYWVLVEGHRLEGGTLTPKAVLVKSLVSSEPQIARGLHLRVRGLRLMPGHWQLRVVVQDHQTSALGSVLHTLEVLGRP